MLGYANICSSNKIYANSENNADKELKWKRHSKSGILKTTFQGARKKSDNWKLL